MDGEPPEAVMAADSPVWKLLGPFPGQWPLLEPVCLGEFFAGDFLFYFPGQWPLLEAVCLEIFCFFLDSPEELPLLEPVCMGWFLLLYFFSNFISWILS
jgi:hypothetical protein